METTGGVQTAEWQRALEHARLLHGWRVARQLGLEETRDAYVRDHPEVVRRWQWEQTVLALTSMHIARNRGLAVDDIRLGDVTALCRRLGPDAAGDLLPLPAGGGELPDAPNFPDVLETVAGLLDAVTGEEGADTRRLGFTIRELRADPEGFGSPLHGGWAILQRIARRHLDLVGEMISDGRWAVSRADQDAARLTGLFQPQVYTYPVAPAPSEEAHPSWLQRAQRLVGLGASLRTLAETLPRDPQGFYGPLATVMASVGGLCDELADTTGELARVWATERPLPSRDWERAHVPEAVLRQTAATEEAVTGFAVFLAGLIPADGAGQ
ncbi:hypothetical protein [Streptomyces sp. NPDC058280]|uniref:hypothetical protein n=1 Tax=Streptomyces sp. NPDC058280 TaxID=3346419 RepID=UPI0036E6ADDE